MARFVILSLLFGAILSAQTYTLTVQVTGFKSGKGSADAALYNGKDGYPTKPEKAFAKMRVPISSGTAEAVFKNLAPGRYAVAVYHDQNGNGRLDTNFIGIPKEPTGASNDAKGRMGPPSFADAGFEVSRDISIVIRLNR